MGINVSSVSKVFGAPLKRVLLAHNKKYIFGARYDIKS